MVAGKATESAATVAGCVAVHSMAFCCSMVTSPPVGRDPRDDAGGAAVVWLAAGLITPPPPFVLRLASG